MGRTLTIISTAVVTAILTSAFWIFAFNIIRAPTRRPGQRRRATRRRSIRPAARRSRSPRASTVGPGRARHPGRRGEAQANWSTPSARRAPAARGSMTRSTSWRRSARPVVAAAPGRVEKIFFSPGGGGNTVYVRSPDGRWSYYYAHLERLRAGPARRSAAAARRSDRLRRLYRQRQSGRAAPPLRDQPDERRREVAPGRADQSLSAACR